MTDRLQWPSVELGFKVHPPRLRRGAGRPRVRRIRGCLEPGRKKVKYKRCKQFGHFEKTCKLAKPLDEDDMAAEETSRKRYVLNPSILIHDFLLLLNYVSSFHLQEEASKCGC